MIEPKVFEKDRNFHGTKGIIFIRNKMLVYRRDNNTANYPLYIDLLGGGKEKNESAFDTFKREVKEEFGINVETRDIVYAKQYISAMDSSKESYFIVVKLDNIMESDIIFSDEGLEYFVLTTEEYLQLKDTIPRQKDKVIEFLNN